MARLRYNGLSTTLGGSLTSGATSVTFAAALTHSGGTAVPTITGSDYIPLSILDSSGHLSEVVNLTAYTSGATTGTISRGQEGTTGVTHASGDRVVHAPTISDVGAQIKLGEVVLGSTAASIGFTSSDIPTAGYSHLRLVLHGRGTVATVNATVNVTFNGDTTAANYKSKRFYGTTLTGYDATASDRGLGFIAGDSATTNQAGVMDVIIPSFLRTTWHKQAHGTWYTPGSPAMGSGEVVWANTAAITSIDVAPTSGSFMAGTVATLYAIS